jgi:hypothetical protein
MSPTNPISNWNRLADYIERGGKIDTRAMRRLLVQILRGDGKRPLGYSKEFRRYTMAAEVARLERQDVGTDDAVKKVARHHDVTERTVYRALSSHRDEVEERHQYFQVLLTKKQRAP